MHPEDLHAGSRSVRDALWSELAMTHLFHTFGLPAAFAMAHASLAFRIHLLVLSSIVQLCEERPEQGLACLPAAEGV